MAGLRPANTWWHLLGRELPHLEEERRVRGVVVVEEIGRVLDDADDAGGGELVEGEVYLYVFVWVCVGGGV